MSPRNQKAEHRWQIHLGDIMKHKNKNKRRLTKNRKYLRAFCFLLSEVCALSSGKAAIIHPLNDCKVIEVPISQTGLTRITVQEDRISNVFGMRGEYEMEADEVSGHVFIRPQDHILHSISITLITEEGHTQDLRLIPQHKAPDALILQRPHPDKIQTSSGQFIPHSRSPRNNGIRNGSTCRDITRNDATCSNVTHHDITRNDITRHDVTCNDVTRNDIEDLLYACAEDRIPVGYHSVKLEIPDLYNPYLLVREIANNELRGLTFEVENYAEVPLFLLEKGFSEKLDLDVVAVLMPKKLLKAGEKMKVYVAVRSI